MIKHGYSPTGYHQQSHDYPAPTGNILQSNNNLDSLPDAACTLNRVQKRNTTQDCGEFVGKPTDAGRTISRLEAALAECREYFADRADADNMNTDPEPNAEMTLLVMIDRVLEGGEV